MRLLLICLSLMIVAPFAWASTFTVEKDGTGNFTVIQDAINVAASGDTIRIGPGRFNDGEMVACPGWTQFIRVLVTQSDLTIIGSGIGNTIIGQEQPWTQAQGLDRGISGGPYFGNYSLHVEGVSLENIHFGLISDPEFDLTVKSCSFSGHYTSISGGGGDLVVDDCIFSEVLSGGYAILSSGSKEVNISNCLFSFIDPGPWSESAIHIGGVLTSSIRNCEFVGGSSGVYCGNSSSVFVDNCIFQGQSLYGVVCSEVADMDISNCLITNQANVGIHSRYSSVNINSTNFAEVNLASISFNDYVDLSANGCILAHGPEYAVRQFRDCSKSEDGELLPHLDFTNNDWGTANADSIEAWIKVCDYVADFIPYVGQPVATEQKTWGGVKAMYR